MAYLVPGDLDACLRVLEAKIRPYQPSCSFYFGGAEEENRPASPPFVRWSVVDAEPAQGTRPDRQPKGVYQLVDDLVVMQARCVGSLLPGLLGPDVRRQQLAASVQVLLSHYWNGRAWLESLLSGIALVMALLPQEITVILTVFLALGAWRMAQHQVLTRRVTAVEVLGAITVLAVCITPLGSPVVPEV